jgi:hypothetical protein
MTKFFLKEQFMGRPHSEVDESPMCFCGVSSELCFLRFLLFDSERLTEDNEGNEAGLLALKNFVSHPGFRPPSFFLVIRSGGPYCPAP